MSDFATTNVCPNCNTDHSYVENGHTYSRVIGVEYAHGSPNRYDGVSEWRCPACGYREGRWSGKMLREGESEPRYGGKP